MNDGLFGKGWPAVVDRFAVFCHATHGTGWVRLTQRGTAVAAIAAVTAHGIEREDDFVSGRDTGYTGTDLSDDTRAFVSHDPRGWLTLDVTIYIVVVAVADTRTNNVKQHFTRLRWLDFEFFNRYGNVGFVKDCCFHNFLQSPQGVRSDGYLLGDPLRYGRCWGIVASLQSVRRPMPPPGLGAPIV